MKIVNSVFSFIEWYILTLMFGRIELRVLEALRKDSTLSLTSSYVRKEQWKIIFVYMSFAIIVICGLKWL